MRKTLPALCLLLFLPSLSADQSQTVKIQEDWYLYRQKGKVVGYFHLHRAHHLQRKEAPWTYTDTLVIETEFGRLKAQTVAQVRDNKYLSPIQIEARQKVGTQMNTHTKLNLTWKNSGKNPGLVRGTHRQIPGPPPRTIKMELPANTTLFAVHLDLIGRMPKTKGQTFTFSQLGPIRASLDEDVVVKYLGKTKAVIRGKKGNFHLVREQNKMSSLQYWVNDRGQVVMIKDLRFKNEMIKVSREEAKKALGKYKLKFDKDPEKIK